MINPVIILATIALSFTLGYIVGQIEALKDKLRRDEQ